MNINKKKNYYYFAANAVVINSIKWHTQTKTRPHQPNLSEL